MTFPKDKSIFKRHDLSIGCVLLFMCLLVSTLLLSINSLEIWSVKCVKISTLLHSFAISHLNIYSLLLSIVGFEFLVVEEIKSAILIS